LSRRPVSTTIRTAVLYNLHLLRVVAALGVVHYHITSDAGLQLDWDIGNRGVDVFFVISGFIIAYIGTSKPESFFLRRMIRVVPFYWAATLFVFAIVSAVPHLFRTTQDDPVHLIYSLLFIPREAPDGGMWPTLVLGWSLNYEMFFYALFAISLWISRRWAPVVTCGWIAMLVVLIRASGTDSSTIGFYAKPIVFEFCLGVVVFYLYQWVDERREVLARFAAGKLLVGAVFVGSLLAIAVLEQHYRGEVSRLWVAGIPAFFIVLSALLLERLYGVRTKSKLIYLLGEASYIIYLVHPYIIYTVLRLAKLDSSLPVPALVLVIVGLIALSSAISVAIHVWFERPVMGYLRKRLT
jgi:exopolysaccharide production protein ExoZ